MAMGYQARALLRGLSKLGEPSFVEGVAVGPVVIERNVATAPTVEQYSEFGSKQSNLDTVRHTTATIDASFGPRVGQTLVHPEGTFVLDKLLEDNGVTRQFVVAQA